ncbi:MAG: N-acetylmuramoyl-L-alanine amidase [Treponema sp.]|jgi:N-acetylmuramoyl-L-alanine amidase|nr:N-acetylmuramoyl-L-alanine amidase [Treponema sp.]
MQSRIILFFIVPLILNAQEKHVTLDELFQQLNGSAPGSFTLRWDPFSQRGLISVAHHFVAFHAQYNAEPSYILIDGTEILNVSSPYLEKGAIVFPPDFVAVLQQLMQEQTERSGFNVVAIVLDPGHGGKDPGASHSHTIDGKSMLIREKDITLDISLRLSERLKKAYPSKQILLTRTEDITLTLDARADFANNISIADNEAILYISIHANSVLRTPHARGFEVWYLDPNIRRTLIASDRYSENKEVIPILNAMLEEEFTIESYTMADSILNALKKVFGNAVPSRGIKGYSWFVVKNVRMPSVLVELGFVTNEEDVRLMITQQERFADALFNGISDFIRRFEQVGAFVSIE